MTITPKTFVAVRDFTIGQSTYVAGDEVPHGRHLAQLLELGGFVEEASASKSSKTTTTTTTTTKKEGSDNGAG